MPQPHNGLRRDQLTPALKAFLGDTKSEGGIERYGETLTPVVDLWADGERNFLRNEILWNANGNQPAVAAEFSMFAVGLPTASRDILIVTGADVRCAVAATIGHTTRAAVNGTLTLGSAGRNNDQRFAAQGFVALNLGNRLESWLGSDPGALIATGEEKNATATDYRSFLSGPWIVKPGGGLLIQAQVVNTAMVVNLWGRLRAAKPGELVNV